MRFKLGDTVCVINDKSRWFDHVGRVTTIDKTAAWLPFAITGLTETPVWYGPEELILAEQEQS